MSNKPLFIVWYSHSRRAETLTADLAGKVSFQYEARLKRLWWLPLRYLVQGWKTWRLLSRERPCAVLVQSPPVFAPLVVAAWCELHSRKYTRIPYVLDCHTGTFHDPAWQFGQLPLRWLARRAAASLVTDTVALKKLQSWGARAILLEDALPLLTAPTGTIGSEGKRRIAVICTFKDDEPVNEIFSAARLLPEVTFYVTGDPKQAPARLLEQKPENVVLTGFLRGGDYSALLKNTQGMVMLTTRPATVNCGAYEALAMGKPALISDWPQLRHTFPRGFIHVANTPEAIAAGIQKMLEEQEALEGEIVAMRTEAVARRSPRFAELQALL